MPALAKTKRLPDQIPFQAETIRFSFKIPFLNSCENKKTSILLGLQFALFGLQPGQKGASILRNGETEASVSLEIEIEGKKVVLERSLKRSKNQSITQESNVIEIEGKRQELSTSEMKNQVIELLDYPKEFIKKSNL
jgi:DNA repair exonuclease SbcCD ATPase subunit